MMRSGMSVPLNKAARHNAVYRAMLAAAPTPAEAPADVARDAEPVAYVTGVYGGHTTVAPIDAAQVLRVGMALYTAPPALELTGARRASGLNEMLGKEPA